MNSRYRVRKKPLGFIRVDDLEDDRVEGYWDTVDKTWFDYRRFVDDLTDG